MKTFTAYIEWDPETKLYVGIIPGYPWCSHREPLWMNSRKI